MPEEDEGRPDPEPRGPDDLDQPPAFFTYARGAPDGEARNLGALVEVRVQGVFAAESDDLKQLFVLVADAERKLPIIIGPFEAQAISLPLENAQPDRPMTHDLLKNVLERLDARLVRVVVDDVWNGVYYAKLHLKRGKEEFEVDARPSDAIALAVRFEAPILVAEGILASAEE